MKENFVTLIDFNYIWSFRICIKDESRPKCYSIYMNFVPIPFNPSILLLPYSIFSFFFFFIKSNGVQFIFMDYLVIVWLWINRYSHNMLLFLSTNLHYTQMI